MAGACSQCGSRRWRKAPGGYRVCEEGHVDRSYRKETVDLGGEPSQSQQRIRRVKSDKKRRLPKSKGRSEIYHGHEKDFLYYECLQLLVRHQVKALRTVWSLPEELEIISRDLLALCLLLHPLPPPPEQEQPQTAKSSPPAGDAPSLPPSSQPVNAEASSSRLEADAKDDDDMDDSDDPDGTRRELEKAHEDEEDEDEDEDEEAEDEDESDEEDGRRTEGDTDGEGEGRSTKSRNKKGKGRATLDAGKIMKPIDCLSIVIVACWTLRVPVMFKEFIQLVESYQLPYLEFAKSPLIPQDLRKRFERELYLTLSPAWPPSVMRLYRNTSNFALQLHQRFGIRIPELNAAPIIWKCIDSLGGTPALYPAVLSLSRSIQLHLSLHQSIAPNDPDGKRDPDAVVRPEDGLKGDRDPPELMIMAVVVIVLKMVYGLDGRDRLPVNGSDPATALMTKRAWLAWLRDRWKREREGFSDQRLAKGDFDILSLEGDSLDRYFDLLETILPSGLPLSKAQSLLHSRFPPPSPPPPAPPQPDPFPHPPYHLLTPSLSSLPPTPPQPLPNHPHRFDTFLLPGEAYPVWARHDQTGILPREAEGVIEWAAAGGVGVKGEELVRVLEGFERRLGGKGREKGRM